MRLFAFLLLLPLLGLNLAHAEDGQPLPVPALAAPVTDQAGLLSTADAQALNQKLLAFAQEKGSQVAVLIVPSTQPEDIFSYGFRVADQWKLGRKGVDDGVLLVIATQDRRSNLQVGYGLEGAIPDARARQVLDDIMAPYFRQGDFAGGINAACDALIKLINGENLPAPTAKKRGSGNDNLIIIAIVAGIVAGYVVRAMLGRGFGAVAGFGVALSLALILGAVIAVALFAAIFAAIFASSSGRAGGFGGGGFGRGSCGGGGGFSGGGGGFGGGGASGSW
ncbi:MAG TPA: TPM domain-containing protein [Moraxellaceae bacterium]